MVSTTHYVDNKRLYSTIVQYKADCETARKNNVAVPPIPDYIGACILLIAQRLATKPNFINYSYKEEMVSDGIENCISYFNNFDPAKSDNPFAYFTQIIYFAFLRRIQKEKKQLYIKHKSIENSLIFNLTADYESSDDDGSNAVQIDYNADAVSDFIKTFEANAVKKKTQRKKGIENFIDEEPLDDGDIDRAL
jgi:hypothetical protein